MSLPTVGTYVGTRKYKPKKPRLSMAPCFGYNPRTRQRVGSRHRWRHGICDFCGQSKESVMMDFSHVKY